MNPPNLYISHSPIPFYFFIFNNSYLIQVAPSESLIVSFDGLRSLLLFHHFNVSFLLLIIAVYVAIHAHAFAVVGTIVMGALRCISRLVSTEGVVTVVAHALGIVLRRLMRTRRHHLPPPDPLLLLLLLLLLSLHLTLLNLFLLFLTFFGGGGGTGGSFGRNWDWDWGLL